MSVRPRRSSLVMIAHISGKLLRVGGSHVVVDAAGVGYKVFVPVSTLMAMPQQGEPVSFHIHTIVKEDAIELYGFANELEQEAFELLISVSGVGPKMALALLSAMSVRELAAAARDDGGRLQTAPGIGRKTAQRIALEVGEKLQELALAAAAESYLTHPVAEAIVKAASDRGLVIPQRADFDYQPLAGVGARWNALYVWRG